MEKYYIDEQSFLEDWLPDYYHCDEVAWLGDMDKVLDNDYEQDDVFVQEYLTMPREELQIERDALARKLMERAFENYLREEY